MKIKTKSWLSIIIILKSNYLLRPLNHRLLPNRKITIDKIMPIN